MSNGQIFISYRRDDSAGYTRAIYDRLVQHFSKDRVFMDVDAIEPGLPFDEAIKHALDKCEVLLVVIGRHWLDTRDGLGPRINDPQDFVRLEIAAALSRNIRVIPVLLDGARMPGEDELPEALGALARRNALEIRNSRFDVDTGTLIMAAAQRSGSKRLKILSELCITKDRPYLTILVPMAVRKALGETENAAQSSSGLSTENLRPDINGSWEADVTYDWPNARYVEKFYFRGEEDEVFGTASFLGRKRGILEGSIRGNRLRFIVRTQEYLGADSNNPKDTVHRYRGKLLGSEIKFSMQTEGGYSEHLPIEFIAKKVPDTGQ